MVRCVVVCGRGVAGSVRVTMANPGMGLRLRMGSRHWTGPDGAGLGLGL